MLFSKVKLYTVHMKPDAGGMADNMRFVPEGFSFMAFLFGVFWALYNRLWMWALIIFALNILIIFAATTMALDDTGAMIVQLALQIWFGFYGYDALRARLKREGYMTMALVSGESKMRAEQRFYDQYAAQLS